MGFLQNCAEVAQANIRTPNESLIQRVLRDNGFSGSAGLDFLRQAYGKVFSNVDSELLFFCGIHVGREVNLMSSCKLRWNHCVMREPMSAGFFQREEIIEHSRFLSLTSKLGRGIEVDVIGCIASKNMCGVIQKAVWSPPAIWWIGVCERGWLAIDLSYFLLVVYESLSALLCDQNGIELIAEPCAATRTRQL